ncbi:MAG: hypothetical protein AB7S26_38000 [Sandaracinaceae bacterium]
MSHLGTGARSQLASVPVASVPVAFVALALVAIISAVIGAFPPVASAHIGHVILSAERYLKLDLAGRDARLVVSLTLGPAEGERVLAEVDADGDERVSRAEVDAYLAAWASGLSDELPVTIDGEPVEVAWGDGYLQPADRVAAVPVTVELVGRFTLGGGEERVRFEDRMVRREVFDRTDVAFRARDGAELLACGTADPDPTDAALDLAYGADFRDGAPVPFLARVRTPEAAITWWPYAIGGSVLAVALAALALVRRRRRA